jgi:hypothetical protein
VLRKKAPSQREFVRKGDVSQHILPAPVKTFFLSFFFCFFGGVLVATVVVATVAVVFAGASATPPEPPALEAVGRNRLEG